MTIRVACGLLVAVAAFGQGVTPYTGEELAQRTETLADGSLATETTASGKVYRDSQGRTRTERATASRRDDGGRSWTRSRAPDIRWMRAPRSLTAALW